MFPETPQELLRKIASFAQGDDAAEWAALVELYTPPLRLLAKSLNSALTEDEIDDRVQEMFVKVVGFLRSGGYDRTHGRLRDYLATVMRRVLVDSYRAAACRPQLAGDDAVPEALVEAVSGRSVDFADPGAVLDAKWRWAIRAAAIEHILSQPSVTERTRTVYRALVAGEGIAAVAVRLGMTRDAVKQVKSRLDRAVAALEARFGDGA